VLERCTRHGLTGLSAPAVAAGGVAARLAAFGADERPAALGAARAVLAGLAGGGRRAGELLALGGLGVVGGLERDGDEVGLGVDEAAAVAAEHPAVDAAQGLDDRFGRYAPLEGDADDAAERFAVGVGLVAALAADDEHLARVVVAVAVDCNEEAALVPVGLHELYLVGEAVHALRTLVRRQAGWGGCGSRLCVGLEFMGGLLFGLGLAGAGGEHLQVAAAVAVDGDALAVVGGNAIDDVAVGVLYREVVDRDVLNLLSLCPDSITEVRVKGFATADESCPSFTT